MHGLLIAQKDNFLKFGIEYTMLSHHNTFSTQLKNKIWGFFMPCSVWLFNFTWRKNMSEGGYM